MARTADSPFRFPIADLLQEHGRQRSVVLDAPVRWSLELSRIDGPLAGELTLEGVSGGILARGRVAVPVRHTCHRCVGEWEDAVEVAVTELLGTDPDDEYRLDGEVADLEPPVRDAVLLTLPLLPTCRPECAGLCAVCGADLNTDACPGHDDEPDSPFAALRGLLEP
jgi:uncharacterized protein